MIEDENALRNLISMYFEDYMLDDLLWDMTIDPADLIIAGIKQGVVNRETLEDILLDE